MSELAITHIPLAKVHPNPWNPNKQTDRQFEAEVESILDNGFIAPIIVRPHPSKKNEFEIVDGEHRKKALDLIVREGKVGNDNVPYLSDNKVIPAVVIEVDETHAKRLTIIMNETRGRADMASLGTLLASIQPELGEDLIVGLPYSPKQLQELVDIASYDWDELSVPVDDDDIVQHDTSGVKVVALLDDLTASLWKSLLEENKSRLSANKQEAAGQIIAMLLHKEEK